MLVPSSWEHNFPQMTPGSSAILLLLRDLLLKPSVEMLTHGLLKTTSSLLISLPGAMAFSPWHSKLEFLTHFSVDFLELTVCFGLWSWPIPPSLVNLPRALTP